MAASRVNEERLRGNRLVSWGERRLEHHASGRLGSLALGWLRRYAESSQNSATALVLYLFLSAVPALLAMYGLAGLSSKSHNGIAQHLIDHLHLHGSTATLVTGTFGSAAGNVAAASVVSLLSFLTFGLGVGKILQEVYARAWRVRVGSPTDQLRFALFFIVSTTLLGLQVSEESFLSSLGWELLVPVWLAVLVAFWLWTPWLLLHRQIVLRQLLPGALIAAPTATAAAIVSQFLLGSWINQNAHFFGSFGVILALLMWGQVLGGLWLTCAIFSPVYAEWRTGWERDGASPFPLTDHQHTTHQTEN